MEIATRELDANLILILFSLKKEFNVFVGDSSTYRFLLNKKFLQPGIVLTKSVTHGEHKSKLHDTFKAQGFILTCPKLSIQNTPKVRCSSPLKSPI